MSDLSRLLRRDAQNLRDNSEYSIANRMIQAAEEIERLDAEWHRALDYGLAMRDKNVAIEAKLAKWEAQPVVAWAAPIHYGSGVYGTAVTFYKPNKPEEWGLADDESDWYCRPLIAKPASKPVKEST